MYVIIFLDRIHGQQVMHFRDFDDAMEYWNMYYDTPTCYGGLFRDLENHKIIRHFVEDLVNES